MAHRGRKHPPRQTGPPGTPIGKKGTRPPIRQTGPPGTPNPPWKGRFADLAKAFAAAQKQTGPPGTPRRKRRK